MVDFWYTKNMKFNFESQNNNEESAVDKLKKAGKKAVLSVALAAGFSAGSGEVVAQNQDNLEKDKVENVEQNNRYEHLVQEVDAKELKKILKDYDNVPGGIPKKMFLDQNSEETLYLSDPVFAEIESAAKMASHNHMKMAGKLTPWPTSFVRESSNGYEYVTVTLKKHVDTINKQ